MAKSPNAFRTISEAATEVGAPQHVLRFWETKFGFVTPLKRAGGRRFYRPQDIAVLNGVVMVTYINQMLARGMAVGRSSSSGIRWAATSRSATPFAGRRT